ncbi:MULTISPECIES: protein-methionine-sulfoxide reductase heme-binding subunit MsrQ [unclassified Moritella]|uniref:protein-methionine-sulfoxide reductase heme-binding subunit MsrQ n=1 Tax=unclassified Moritella TaxID=2637987 RepID=UPI001BA5C887|nr:MULTISPECIES: protein-methionine-sulfoxide reductase heme-binding subunit MsrQ [unclassified Moritella]QUM86880.1 protein-methionine-sulfoxide reductase heme-binding subunit MsrQ [Moritella sp. 28]QUM91104.1 protein-methionine-sulfoxide reductase heme-binding subunit MsrQ [Moritella sp. 36]
MPVLTYKRMPYLKAYIHILAIMPLVYLGLAINADALGGDPVQAVIHFLGKGALNLLLATLAISPLAKRYKEGLLISTRRLVGLYCFFYATLHLVAFAWLDLGWDLGLFLQELIKRPYIWLGMVAFIILLLLALTSPMCVRRKMQRNWQKLHNFIYLAAVLTPVHYYLSVKSGWIEPIIYAFLVILLLSSRRK